MGRAQDVNIPAPVRQARLSRAARAHIDASWRGLVEAAAHERKRLLDELNAARRVIWAQRMEAARWQEKAEQTAQERDHLFALLVDTDTPR